MEFGVDVERRVEVEAAQVEDLGESAAEAFVLGENNVGDDASTQKDEHRRSNDF